MKRRWVRWLPAAVIPAAIAAGALIAPLTAGAADLPSKTPADVLKLVAASDVRAFSGTVEQSSDLGLPSLPTVGSGPGSQSDATNVIDLLTGSHTAKVYADGPSKVRVQVLDQLAERDVVRNGADVWLYTSTGEKVTHVTLPSRTAEKTTPDATTTTPAQLAERFLASVEPSTSVTLGANTTVAGRDAYDLVLTPNTSATLVGSVSIAVDGQTGVPLRVQVAARGQQSTAFEVGFSSFDPSAPSADVFAFTPPKGATVTEQALPAKGERTHAEAGHPKPVVSGTGWSSIVTVPVGTVPASVTSSPLYGQLTTAVPGGRALSTSLMSVLLTDDGRVLAGAVPVSALEAAAAK
ncbi:outer membrane lipoprotein carrier protein LolA [Leifsonia sp. NPDC058248]|uniref:LolA family protein n=1 Tax=Leifsonia sp. NPDC058248 TaxID=3346402 RepID=UPI0036DDE2E1